MSVKSSVPADINNIIFFEAKAEQLNTDFRQVFMSYN